MPIRKLTARFVETARFAEEPPSGARPRKTSKQLHRTEIRDTEVRGLELRIERDRTTPDDKILSGSKRWASRYRRQSDGKKRTITLGPFPAYSLEKARTWAQRTLSGAEVRTLWLAPDRASASRGRWKRQEADFPMRRGTALRSPSSLHSSQGSASAR